MCVLCKPLGHPGGESLVAEFVWAWGAIHTGARRSMKLVFLPRILVELFQDGML